MKQIEQTYITRKDFATYFGISVATVVKLIDLGTIKEIKFRTDDNGYINPIHRIHVDQIEKLEKQKFSY